VATEEALVNPEYSRACTFRKTAILWRYRA
jgi:hypothetical protein